MAIAREASRNFEGVLKKLLPLNNLNVIEMVLKNETIAYQRLKCAKHTKIGNLEKMLIEND